MKSFAKLAEHLAHHDGVISRTQAVELGLTVDEVRGRLERGEWKPLTRGVYRSASHDYGDAVLVRGAVLAHRGVAELSTAQWWHRFIDDLPSPLQIASPSATTATRWTLCPVQVSRHRFHPSDVVEVRGLPVTSKPMTILSAAGVRKSDGARVIDHALQTGAVSLDALVQSLERNAGKWHMKQARAMLRVAMDDADSAAERLFVQLLHDEQITGWVQQLRFGPWLIDVAWPTERVAVEIDGWAFHNSVHSFGNDRAKGNALQRAGWRRLNFTWHDLTEDPIDCVNQVAVLLQATI